MSDMPTAVGVLPALGSGLTDLRRSGQHVRLLDYDLRHYAGAWERVYYFSYFHDEALEDFTRDPLLLRRVVVVPRPRGWPRRLYALAMPLLHRRRFRECAALRVEQFPGVIPALIARALYGIPFVVTYGYHYAEIARLAGSRVKPWLYTVLERVALRCAAGVVVPSEEMETRARARGASHLVRVPNGVDTARFAPAPPEEGQKRERVLLYVGRLEPEKNLLRLVDAVARLGERRIRLVLVGDGRVRADLVARAGAAGVALELPGVVPHDELPKRFAEADVFVLPSLTEGHPKALIEAMACGVPCAASARGGIPSLIEHGVTGLLFDPEDPDAIARTLAALLDDEPQARRLAAAARAIAVERFDVHRLLDGEVAAVRAVAATASGQLFEDYAENFPIDDVLPEFVERRLTDLAATGPRTMLDVGAGDGRWVGLLSRLSPNALVVGCEISHRRAVRMRAKGLRVVAARAEALPFRAGAFDLVTCIEVIEHTASPAATVDEMHRVLRPAGRLVLTTPNYPAKRLYDLRAALRARDRRRFRDDPTHISPQSATRLERLLRRRFPSAVVEGTAIFGEGRIGWLARWRQAGFGRRLANKLYALCVKGA